MGDSTPTGAPQQPQGRGSLQPDRVAGCHTTRMLTSHSIARPDLPAAATAARQAQAAERDGSRIGSGFESRPTPAPPHHPSAATPTAIRGYSYSPQSDRHPALRQSRSGDAYSLVWTGLSSPSASAKAQNVGVMIRQWYWLGTVQMSLPTTRGLARSIR